MPASRQKPNMRLLVVSDAALAGADQLPHSVRALIDAAGELYVVTPSLPGRASSIAATLRPAPWRMSPRPSRQQPALVGAGV